MGETGSAVRRRDSQRRVLWLVLWANAAFAAVEFAGGLIFDSLALLADSAHMLSDVIALAVALAAQSLIDRPASARHTYGLQRAEVLGALANGVILIVAVAWIVVEAIQRIGTPSTVSGAGVFALGLIGLAVNAFSAALLAQRMGRSLNMRGAYLHMLFDALGSAGAVAAGVAVIAWDANAVDPAVSLGIAALIVWSTWSLLRETVHVLLEGAPRDIDVAKVEAAIASHTGVESVHHVHVWNLASDVPALSAHVVIEDDVPLHEAQVTGDSVKSMLAVRFGIEHATLEFECHGCEPAYETHRPHGHSSS
jgi:cobalt-zinc-cadmium efflux system protein